MAADVVVGAVRRCSYFIFIVARRIGHPLVAGQARYGSSREVDEVVGGHPWMPKVSESKPCIHPLPCRTSVPTAA